MSALRIGDFEPHCKERQEMLRSRARQEMLRSRALTLCEEIVAATDPRAVFLSGSVARGPVGPSSDLDLHVIVDNSHCALPVWRFTEGGIIENVHTLHSDVVREGLSKHAAPEALARWFHRTSLGDELFGSELLYCSGQSSALMRRFRRLLALRFSPFVRRLLAAQHAQQAIAGANRSQDMEALGHPLEARQLLRLASQSLLIASLISAGWGVRGAKKRPEIATLYATDECVSRVLLVFLDANGLTDITPGTAKRLCTLRHEFRSNRIEEFRTLLATAHSDRMRARLQALLDRARLHNHGATDYYAGVLQSGCHRGVVNHLRCLSSFKDVPLELLSALSVKPASVDSFLRCVYLSGQIRSKWLDISGLMVNDQLREVRSALLVEARRLANS